jgi:hypothetical protein
MFYPFKIKDIITLLGVILLGFGWVLIDQIFLSSATQRFMALIVVLLLLFFGQFFINKPSSIWKYANTLALISLILVVLISVIMHVIINHDLSSRAVLIWVLTVILPYVSAAVYKLYSKICG